MEVGKEETESEIEIRKHLERQERKRDGKKKETRICYRKETGER